MCEKGIRQMQTLSRLMMRRAARAGVLALSALSALSASGASRSVAGNGETAVMRAAEQWVSACHLSEGVETYTGGVSSDQVVAGFAVFEAARETLPTDKMSAKEACLSLAASSDAQTPVYVIEKPHLTNSHQQQPKAVTRQMETKAMVDRLTDLNIRLFSMRSAQGQENLNAMMEVDENMAHEILHFGVITGSERLARSFSVNGDKACMIGLETSPLERYTKARLHNDDDSESSSVNRYIARFGNATEFWHEVAHCNAERVAKDLDKQNEPLSGDKSATPGCSSNYTASRIGGSGSGQSEVGAARIGQGMQAGAQFTSALDTRALFSIREEAMADDWATMKVANLGGPAKGCNYQQGVSHPWQKYRVIDSIHNPSLDYMTWLYPWIEGQSRSVQVQMMADAFKGMFLAAKEMLPEYRYEALVRQKGLIAGSGVFGRPSRTANPERAQAWQQWLINQATEKTLSGIAQQ